MKLTQKQVHLLFKIGVVSKAIDGFLEVVAGIALFFVTTGSLRDLVDWLTRGELREDPDDFVATHLTTFFHHLSINSKHFAAIYLLTYGIVKLGLVTGLLLEKLWAYPTALVVLGLFLCYQVYRITHTHSLSLAFFSLIDLFILFFIWRDYRYLKARPTNGKTRG